MQNIIVCVILSLLYGSILSIFTKLSKSKKGQDFTFKEFKNNLKLKNINLKYVLVFFIVLYVMVHNSGIKDILLFAPLCFSLLLAFMLDFIFMIIPDTASIVIVACAIVKNLVYFSKTNCVSSILGLIVGGLTFYIINFICEKITGKSGFGLGDVKLLGALGLFLGLKEVVVIMLLSVMISAVFSVFFLIAKAIIKFSEEYIPFGPFIVLSSFLVYLISADTIINLVFKVIDKIIT